MQSGAFVFLLLLLIPWPRRWATGSGTNVLSLARAVGLGGVDEVEIAGLAAAVFASGGSQDGPESFKAGGLNELHRVAGVASDRFG
jgi:hypothetical protein